MKKSTSYILLGVTIAVVFYVFAGIIYFRPATWEETVVAIEEPKAVQPSVEAPIPPVAEKQPEQGPEPKITEELEKEEVPVPAIIEITEEAAAPIEEPEKKEVAAPELPEEIAAAEEAIPQHMVPEEVVKPVPPPPVLQMAVSPVVLPKEAKAQPEKEAAEEIKSGVEEEPVVPEEVVKPVPPPPVLQLAVSPVVLPKEETKVPSVPAALTTEEGPLPYLWTEVTMPEGEPIHLDPISFSKFSFEKRKVAVDEILDQLVWE